MGQRADELTPHDDAGHSDAEIQQLRTGIARTRTEMGSTIDAIGKVEEMVDELDDRARSARMTLMETIRENPLPATVAGLGLGWLWMRSRSRTTVDQSRDWRSSSRASWSDMDRGRGGPDVTGTLGRAQDRAGEVVGQARDTVSHIAGDANDLANDASERVRRLATTAGSTARDTGFAVWDMIQSNPVPAALAGISLAWLFMGRNVGMGGGDTSWEHSWSGSMGGHRGDWGSHEMGRGKGETTGTVHHARGQVERMLDETPLAVGAVALGLGAALGLVMPSTDREREIMGDARESLMQKTQEAAQDAQQRIQQVAERVQETVKGRSAAAPSTTSPSHRSSTAWRPDHPGATMAGK